MRAPAPVTMLVLASVMVLAGCGSYPQRSAAEYVSPGRFHAVTVTATISNPRYPRPLTVTRRFTSAVVITQLADTLNGAPAMPAGTFSCTAGTASYELAFETTPGAHPSLLAHDRECGGVAITVWGKVQPPLKASFASTAAKLLGFQHAR